LFFLKDNNIKVTLRFYKYNKTDFLFDNYKFQTTDFNRFTLVIEKLLKYKKEFVTEKYE